jgi:4-amino-4-deoxy-L-arabinose transferase-like glycosyltransferase
MVNRNNHHPSQSEAKESRSEWILFLMLAIAFAVLSVAIKIPILDQPFIGSHLFRQLQTLSTIEGFLHGPLNVLQPRANYAGYPGFLLLEFPLFQVICTWMAKLFGDPLVVTRSINIIFGLSTSIVLYFFGRLFYGKIVSTLVAVLFLFAPINLMYHASTLIDPMIVFCSVLAAFALCQRNLGEPTLSNALIYLICSLVILITKPLYYFPNALLLIGFFTRDVLEKPSIQSAFLHLKSNLLIIVITAVGGIVMITWLMVSTKLTTHVDTLSHLSWTVLKNPGTYFTYALRYLFYLQTPITLMLSIIGLIYGLSSRSLRPVTIVFLILPVSFYLAFANINRPHDYYSLILVPYAALIAGNGLSLLVDSDRASNYPIRLLKPAGVLVTAVLLSLYLYFSNYWITPSTLNRYTVVAEITEDRLDPFEYTVVWVNKNGNFAIDEYLSESRRNVVSAKLGKLDESKIRSSVTPIYGPPLMYALNHQYGEMIWYAHSLSASDILRKIDEYEGNLRYAAIYMDRNNDLLKESIDFPIALESEELLVFDLKALQ